MWTAWKHTLGNADLLSSGVGAGLAIIVHFFPKAAPAVTASLWEIPIWALASVAVMRLCCAPYWIWKTSEKEIKNLKDQVAQLVSENAPTLRITFDEELPFSTIEMFHDAPSRRLVSVSVENIGGKYLEHCQVYLRYEDEKIKYPRSKFSELHGRHASCPPFSLVSDDVKAVHILYGDDPTYPGGEKNQHLCVFSYAEQDGEWGLSMGIPVLVEGAYKITVEALSANTRRASLELSVVYENNEWVIRNASIP